MCDYSVDVRDLLDNYESLARSPVSQSIWKARLTYLNSVGKAVQDALPSSASIELSTIYDVVFRMANAFMPRQFERIDTTPVRWSDYARILSEISLLESNLRDYAKDNWLGPISRMMLINPPMSRESVNAWLIRLLNNQDTTTDALTAQTYLETYVRLVKIPVKQAAGDSDSLTPICEPGIKALQVTGDDGFTIESKRIDKDKMFCMILDSVVALFMRINPDKRIGKNASILVPRISKQVNPRLMFFADTIVVIPSTSLVWQGDTLTCLAANALSSSAKVRYVLTGRDNLVISPSMVYTLMYSLNHNQTTAGVNTLVLIVTDNVSGTVHTVDSIPTGVQLKMYEQGTFKLEVGYHSVTNEPMLDYTVEWTSSVNVGTFTSGFATEIMVDSPVARLDETCLISSTASVGSKSEVILGSVWGDYYGTQFDTSSMIDPDLSLVGYIDNYFGDFYTMRNFTAVLKNLIENGSLVMKVVDDNDTDFNQAYRGTEGFAKLVDDLSIFGVASFLGKSSIFNTGITKVRYLKMLDVFRRFTAIINTIKNLHTYGDQNVRDAVDAVLTL